jgi:hypothetical protein
LQGVTVLAVVSAVAAASGAAGSTTVFPVPFEQHNVSWLSQGLSGNRLVTYRSVGECRARITFPTRLTLKAAQTYFHVRTDISVIGSTTVKKYKVWWSEGNVVTWAPGQDPPYTRRTTQASYLTPESPSHLRLPRWTFTHPRIEVRIQTFEARIYGNGSIETPRPDDSVRPGWAYCYAWQDQEDPPPRPPIGHLGPNRFTTQQNVAGRLATGEAFKDGTGLWSWDYRRYWNGQTR